jgi:26S proteasome regulatory subunit N11
MKKQSRWVHFGNYFLTQKKFSRNLRRNPNQAMLALSEAYNKSVIEETTLSPEELKNRHVGKQDPKRHLQAEGETLMSSNLVQCLGGMMDVNAF